MYIPKHFKMSNEDLYEFIEKNSFATLFSFHNGEPYATHLPLILHKEEGVLFGHFARTNGQWQDIQNQNILIVFQGPHCYISPSWYETNKAVPTWNYVAVHVYGQMEIIDDSRQNYDLLLEMVNKYEKKESSYLLEDVDACFIDGMSKGVIGFKVKIIKIEGKAKLSQNHSTERQELVINQLEKTVEDSNKQIAKLMRRNLDTES